jgi:predicted amidohydrolase
MEYRRFISIACVNFQTKWGDKKANLEKMKLFAAEASRVGSNLVVFPELALSGYECDESIHTSHQPCNMHRELAEPVPGPSTLEMAEVAREFGITIVFGMPEQDKDNPASTYISSVVISPKKILGTYRKMHLAPSPNFTEDVCFKRGREIPVWKTEFGPIGVLICYDFWYFPELARIAVLKGARVIINTTASSAGPAKPYFIVQQTGCRATENIVYAATANLVGKDRTKSFAGHSVIAGPLDNRPAHIFAEAGESEEIISAALDFEKLRIRNESMPWRKSRQSKLISEEFKKLL